jgi:hypothetical protein
MRRRGATESAPGQQRLALLLEGITASDYLAWARDPEPHALGRELRSVRVHAHSLEDRIELSLRWSHNPPPPREAVVAAGFQLTPEVAEIRPSDL